MSQEIDTPATGSPTRVHYTCGPNNEAMPVDPHDHDIFGLSTSPTIDPGDVLKRLDDLTRRVNTLEQELAGLAILMSKISPRRIEKLEEEIKLLHNSRCGAHQVNPGLRRKRSTTDRM